jgi:hypothetical protein
MNRRDGLQKCAAVVERRSDGENLHRLFGVSMPEELPLHIKTIAGND